GHAARDRVGRDVAVTDLAKLLACRLLGPFGDVIPATLGLFLVVDGASAVDRIQPPSPPDAEDRADAVHDRRVEPGELGPAAFAMGVPGAVDQRGWLAFVQWPRVGRSDGPQPLADFALVERDAVDRRVAPVGVGVAMGGIERGDPYLAMSGRGPHLEGGQLDSAGVECLS